MPDVGRWSRGKQEPLGGWGAEPLRRRLVRDERASAPARIARRARAAAGSAALAAVLICFLVESPVFAVKPGLNSYFQSGFTDLAYQQKCLDKVLKAWTPPKSFPKAGKKTVVQSSIARDGSLIAAVVTLKSGSESWDERALAAVQKAAPFSALPDSYSGPQLEVHWHFAALP